MATVNLLCMASMSWLIMEGHLVEVFVAIVAAGIVEAFKSNWKRRKK